KTKVRLFPAWLIFVFSIVWIVLASLDWFLRLSWETRAVLFLLQLAGAGYLFWKHVLVPYSKKLDERRAALLVERQMPEFDSSLVSVVEFCETPGGYPQHARGTIRALVEQVANRALVSGLAEKVVDAGPAKRVERKALIAAGVLVLAIALAGLPLSWTLGKRIFLSRDPLPGDTTLISMTEGFTVDAGSDATVSVRALGVIPPVATLKIQSEGGKSLIPVNVTTSGEQSLYTYTVKNVRESFRYQFEANDGESESFEVTANIPPHLESVRFVQSYPKYTRLPDAEMSPGVLRLLEGSSLQVEAKATEPLRSAYFRIADHREFRMDFSGSDHKTFMADLTIPESGWKSFSIGLDAGDNRKSSKEPVYRVEIVRDRPPSASIVLPKKDRITVTPDAEVKVSYKAADDFGLTAVKFCYRVEDPKSTASQVDGLPRPMELVGEEPQNASGDRVLNLAQLVPRPQVGALVYVWIEAQDNNGIRGPVVTLSKQKVIAVVSEEQKRMELLEQISQRAKEIEKLYERQRDVNQKTDESIRANRKP
ncbi:MAG TPA: hypothetical protein VGE67_14880, partial [Haloferula sp.]